jgi:hypothetical protein
VVPTLHFPFSSSLSTLLSFLSCYLPIFLLIPTDLSSSIFLSSSSYPTFPPFLSFHIPTLLLLSLFPPYPSSPSIFLPFFIFVPYLSTLPLVPYSYFLLLCLFRPTLPLFPSSHLSYTSSPSSTFLSLPAFHLCSPLFPFYSLPSLPFYTSPPSFSPFLSLLPFLVTLSFSFLCFSCSFSYFLHSFWTFPFFSAPSHTLLLPFPSALLLVDLFNSPLPIGAVSPVVVVPYILFMSPAEACSPSLSIREGEQQIHLS